MPAQSRLSNLTYKELDELYNGLKLTTPEIAARFGVTDDIVRYRMDQLGIARRDKADAARGPHPWNRRLHLDCDELHRLYIVEALNTSKIGERYGVDAETVRRQLKECGVERRDKSNAAIRYERHDFSGGRFEKAYLIGFRQGDLYVTRTNQGLLSASITVTCTTTDEAQIHLFRELFEKYGHVSMTATANRNQVVSCHVNRSFDFLLPKQDKIESWILNDLNVFVAFLAGYIDAEGCFNVPSDGTAIFRLASYDINILRQTYSLLGNQLGVECPPPRLAIPKGYRQSNGYCTKKDFWAITFKRKAALYRFCSLLEPYLRHGGRRNDMQAVYRNVIERGIEMQEQL